MSPLRLQRGIEVPKIGPRKVQHLAVRKPAVQKPRHQVGTVRGIQSGIELHEVGLHCRPDLLAGEPDV